MSSVTNNFPDSNQIEKIEIKKASEVLNDIFSGHNEKIFCKIDCEGAEYEIIPELDDYGLLNKIDLIIMEWHDNPAPLICRLRKNNFFVFATDGGNKQTGIIRAVKL